VKIGMNDFLGFSSKNALQWLSLFNVVLLANKFECIKLVSTIEFLFYNCRLDMLNLSGVKLGFG
jgi:hypothetical protein